MLLFRSEEHVDRWCAERNLHRGAVLSIDQGWHIARAWYHDRLDHDFRGRTPDEATAMFAAAGLAGPFWQPAHP